MSEDAEPDGGTATAMLADGAPAPAAPAGTGDQVWAVAERAYRLSLRTHRAHAVAVVFGLFTAAVVRFGATSVGPSRLDAVVASLAQLGIYVVPLAALAVGYDAVVGARETGTLDVLLALPVARRWIVVGTFLGRAAALGGATLVGFLPGGLVVFATLGPGGLAPYAVVTLASVLLGWAFLAVAMVVSTLAGTKPRALGGALLVWLWFALLHDLLALALIAGISLPPGGVAVAVLTNPADCFRLLALAQVDVVAGGFGAVMRSAGLSLPLALGGLVAWIAGPVAVAGWLLDRR